MKTKLKDISLSIVTVNLNNIFGLEKTIESVVNQTWKDFEYIVIDGGSTDGSYDVIEKYKDQINYWVSEKDKGIYNAMNKGIINSKGKYLLFLNSGDILFSNYSLEKISIYLCDDISVISCKLMMERKGNVREKIPPEKLNMKYMLNHTLPHPSTFIKRELFGVYGLYNEFNKIVSDWEFFFKILALNGESYRSVDVFVSLFDNNLGISSMLENESIIVIERENILRKYLKLIYNDELEFSIFSYIRNSNKRIKYLISIENNIFFRKVVTVFLSIINKVMKILP